MYLGHVRRRRGLGPRPGGRVGAGLGPVGQAARSGVGLSAATPGRRRGWRGASAGAGLSPRAGDDGPARCRGGARPGLGRRRVRSRLGLRWLAGRPTTAAATLSLGRGAASARRPPRRALACAALGRGGAGRAGQRPGAAGGAPWRRRARSPSTARPRARRPRAAGGASAARGVSTTPSSYDAARGPWPSPRRGRAPSRRPTCPWRGTCMRPRRGASSDWGRVSRLRCFLDMICVSLRARGIAGESARRRRATSRPPRPRSPRRTRRAAPRGVGYLARPVVRPRAGPVRLRGRFALPCSRMRATRLEVLRGRAVRRRQADSSSSSGSEMSLCTSTAPSSSRRSWPLLPGRGPSWWYSTSLLVCCPRDKRTTTAARRRGAAQEVLSGLESRLRVALQPGGCAPTAQYVTPSAA